MGFVNQLRGIILGELRKDEPQYAKLKQAYKDGDEATVADEVDALFSAINTVYTLRSGSRIRLKEYYYSAMYGALSKLNRRPPKRKPPEAKHDG